MKRILPISSIRFFLALWVFLGHFHYPILSERVHTPALWAMRSLLQNSFNGPAAVMAFFVISGFCIHFPNRNGLESFSWSAYYTRRYVRILIPMGVAIILAIPLRLRLGLYVNYILWSLLCEEIYYLIYPGLLRIRDLLGWRTLMILAWLGALMALLTNPAAKEYHNLGPYFTWVLGLPVWLIGARMAERLELYYSISVSPLQIWLWRCGVWVLSVGLSVLRFHTVISFPWTLNGFAVVAAYWLQREISYFHGREVSPILERLGDSSYSIYLTHMHGAMFAGWIVAAYTLRFWWLNVIVTTLFSSAFYLFVERPSHHLARRCSRRVAQRQHRVEALDHPQTAAPESTL